MEEESSQGKKRQSELELSSNAKKAKQDGPPQNIGQKRWSEDSISDDNKKKAELDADVAAFLDFIRKALSPCVGNEQAMEAALDDMAAVLILKQQKRLKEEAGYVDVGHGTTNKERKDAAQHHRAGKPDDRSSSSKFTWAKLCELAKKTEVGARANRGSNSPALVIQAQEWKDDVDCYVPLAGYKSSYEDTSRLDKVFSKLEAGRGMRIYYEMEKGTQPLTIPYDSAKKMFFETIAYKDDEEPPKPEDFDSIISTFYPNTSMAISLLLTEETNEDAQERKNYIPGFVETIPKDYAFHFASGVPPSKSQALLVAGVSGAGKTWLTRFGLPLLFGAEVAFLFCTLDNDVADKIKRHDDDVPSWMSRAMSFLFEKVREAVETSKLPDNSELYKMISKSSMHLNRGRHGEVKRQFEEMCKKKINGRNNQDLTTWWQGNGPTVEKLVVVIDECGKSLPFTRGAIDCCRDLVGDLCRNRAQEVMIVLAGTRLDTWSEDDNSFQTRSEHGTDPSKYVVVQMEKPILNKLKDTDKKISAGDLKGWYSQILAENTRILMRAVIPTLTIDALTEHYYDLDGKKLSEFRREDRVAAGSNNALMRFGARVYYVNNGVKELQNFPKERYDLFSSLFGLFLSRSLNKRKAEAPELFSNQAERMKEFHVKIPEDNLTSILAKGLAQENPSSSPNRAMEYLACHGENLPLDFGEGLELEDALAVHLKKYYYCSTRKIAKNFTLSAPWAPASGAEKKGDAASGAEKKGDAASGAEGGEPPTPGSKYDNRPVSKQHKNDVVRLVAMIKKLRQNEEGKSIHIVLRQGIKSAEGPDVMVISVFPPAEDSDDKESDKVVATENPEEAKQGPSTAAAKKNDEVGGHSGSDSPAWDGEESEGSTKERVPTNQATASKEAAKEQQGIEELPAVGITQAYEGWLLRLDLYQCKNFTDFKAKCREDWFHTVGVLDNGGKMEVSDQYKAGYCSHYVNHLLEEVGRSLDIQDRSIGLRAVVVLQSAGDVKAACYKSNRTLSAAGQVLKAVEQSDANVCLWTSDCLHPTISVMKVLEGEDDDNNNDEGQEGEEVVF